jgi:ribosomal protein L1
MATLQERLDEAEAAYHDLVVGKKLVQFHDSNGEQVTFTAATRGALAAYIQDLQRQLGNCPDLGPMRPMWR